MKLAAIQILAIIIFASLLVIIDKINQQIPRTNESNHRISILQLHAANFTVNDGVVYLSGLCIGVWAARSFEYF